MQRLLIFIFTAFIFFGCGEKKDHEDNYNLENEGPVQDMQDTTTGDTSATTQSEIVREGIIDVAAIDQNKDSKLYECPMDWNVIADYPGNCPLCKMELEEFTVTAVKDNLKKNDYQVK